MKLLRQRRESVELNLTPLIDVVFLLLIFFMVSTTFETRPALELTLPESASAEAAAASPLRVSISEQGEYALNGSVVDDRKALQEALAGRVDVARKQGLVIEADARARHQAVVAVLDEAAALDISRVRIATTSQSRQKP
jgi:biopolymer transport protein ExbD